jgi:hypothetical protein
MAFTQAHLDALNEALVSSKLSIEFSGPQGTRRITYRSQADILRARDIVMRSLGLTAPHTDVRMSADKGT